MQTPFEQPEAGSLLIAEPMLYDPNFRRTVVLVCEHHAEGSVGFVLNQTLPVTLGELIDSSTVNEIGINSGGPVQPETLHVIHRHGDIVAGSMPLGDAMYWGGDFEIISAMLQSGRYDHNDFRFFLGYAGWAPGQLEGEIERGGWIVGRAMAEDVFDEDPERMWRRVLRRMGGDYALMANFPEFPSLN